MQWIRSGTLLETFPPTMGNVVAFVRESTGRYIHIHTYIHFMVREGARRDQGARRREVAYFSREIEVNFKSDRERARRCVPCSCTRRLMKRSGCVLDTVRKKGTKSLPNKSEGAATKDRHVSETDKRKPWQVVVALCGK